MKRLLDVGQCQPDHAGIRRLAEHHFDVEVVQAHHLQDMLAELRAGHFDLVLINRKLDADYSEGLDLLRAIKAEPDLAATPVMLVTNYPESQQQAQAAGAVAGFGKDQLRSPATVELLSRYLDE